MKKRDADFRCELFSGVRQARLEIAVTSGSVSYHSDLASESDLR